MSDIIHTGKACPKCGNELIYYKPEKLEFCSDTENCNYEKSHCCIAYKIMMSLWDKANEWADWR